MSAFHVFNKTWLKLRTQTIKLEQIHTHSAEQFAPSWLCLIKGMCFASTARGLSKEPIFRENISGILIKSIRYLLFHPVSISCWPCCSLLSNCLLWFNTLHLSIYSMYAIRSKFWNISHFTISTSNLIWNVYEYNAQNGTRSPSSEMENLIRISGNEKIKNFTSIFVLKWASIISDQLLCTKSGTKTLPVCSWVSLSFLFALRMGWDTCVQYWYIVDEHFMFLAHMHVHWNLLLAFLICSLFNLMRYFSASLVLPPSITIILTLSFRLYMYAALVVYWCVSYH